MTVHEDLCRCCGAELAGRQRFACSPLCRKRLSRQGSRPAHRPCSLCGEDFAPRTGLQRWCHYEDEASDECREEQDERTEYAEYLAAKRAEARVSVCQGPDCAAALLPSGGRGRPARFCSKRCKNKAYRTA